MSVTEVEPNVSPAFALGGQLRNAAPALIFGFRLWASVCLAFYVAFKIELPEAAWAATTAALVCQPALGASLRKASFRMIGTVVGAAGTVALAAVCRQDPLLFLGGLALGCGLSAFVATLLRNYAAYGAALAGFTSAILASDILGAIGATTGDVTLFAFWRSVEICVGILSAGIVLALTDLGHARKTLAGELAKQSAAIAQGLIGCFAAGKPDPESDRARRRQLLGGVIALDPLIDTAIGESTDLRARSPILQQAVIGLLETIASWRRAALRISASGAADDGEAAIRERLPADLSAPVAAWMADPVAMRSACFASARALVKLDAQTPSERLLADSAADGMLGAAKALNGLIRTVGRVSATLGSKPVPLRVADWLPALVNAARAVAIVAILSVLWVVTAWTSGTLAITFGAVVAVLFPLQGDQAFSASMTFLHGCLLSVTGAALITFWLLPAATTFPALCLVLGIVLVPCGFFIALPWRPLFFFAGGVNLLPMLSIQNAMVYDAAGFWNNALAILTGLAVGTIMMRVAPPLSPAFRTRRLLSLMLNDLRRLARRPERVDLDAWTGLTRARLLAIPTGADPLERAQASSALAVGAEIIRLSRAAPRFASTALVYEAFVGIADGDSAAALAGLDALDRRLAALPVDAPGGRAALRVRARVLSLRGELREFASFYDS